MHRLLEYSCIDVTTETSSNIQKNIFACLFSDRNTISLSQHEQECLISPQSEEKNFFSCNYDLATIREILLSSWGNVNSYVAHIQSLCTLFFKNNELLGYFKRNTLKRNLTSSCFVFPWFQDHLLSPELLATPCPPS